MNWYLAKIIFQIICGEGDHTAQFDEQLRLVSADDEHSAFHKAFKMGTCEEESFENRQHQLVQWKFINVAELYRLNGLIDGAELYSRIYETEDAGQYINNVHRKATHIRYGETHQILHLF